METDAERLCRLAYDRYSAGDWDGLLKLFDPEVEVFVAPPNIESGTCKGHAQYRALIQRWGAVWDKMRIEPQDVESEGDWILALVHYIGCGKGSGVEITQPSWELSMSARTLPALLRLLGRGAWTPRLRGLRGQKARLTHTRAM